MRSIPYMFLLSILLFSSALSAKELRLLTTEYPPFSIAGKSGGGLFAELITEALGRKGWTVRVRSVPWVRVPLEVTSGRADGALICWPEEIKKFDLLPSRAAFTSELGFFVRKADADKINVTLAGVRGQKVGAVRGYGYPPTLEASGAHLDYVHDDQTNLRKLLAHRIDYVALEKVVGEYLLQQPELAEVRDKMVWKAPPFARLPLFVGIARQLPNAASILADLNDGLAAMAKDGSYQALAQRYQLSVTGLPSP